MVLVDTSAWIDLFRRRETAAAVALTRILDDGRPFAVTPVIMQEVLQGAADEREFALLHDYFTTQRMLLPADAMGTHVRAARLYFDCRRKGQTPRSTVDCIIAQIAIDHDAVLLHNDQDFERIAGIVPQLKLA